MILSKMYAIYHKYVWQFPAVQFTTYIKYFTFIQY